MSPPGGPKATALHQFQVPSYYAQLPWLDVKVDFFKGKLLKSPGVGLSPTFDSGSIPEPRQHKSNPSLGGPFWPICAPWHLLPIGLIMASDLPFSHANALWLLPLSHLRGTWPQSHIRPFQALCPLLGPQPLWPLPLFSCQTFGLGPLGWTWSLDSRNYLNLISLGPEP